MEATVIDNGNGSYSVSYTPKEAGVYSVWVCVKAQHVKVENFRSLCIFYHILIPKLLKYKKK